VGLPGKSGIGRAVVGLITAGAAVLAVTPSATTQNVALASFSSPHLSGNYIPPVSPPPRNWHPYRGHDWDGNRRRDGGWEGHPWRWWHDSGITGARCRAGGGHVEGDRHRCEGGRYDDFRIR
jgi:hypothetical protein